MKNIKILILLAISAMLTGTASAANIDKLEAIDNNTIELTATPGITFSNTNVEGEVKLLKDIPVSFSTIDPDNMKKVLLNLSSDLTANTSYSLITILGADGNIDFSIPDYLEGEIINSALVAGTKGLEKINIIDSRTMELYFTSDLTSETFEFKILSDIEINSLSSTGDNKLSLEIAKNLEKSTAYIIMILSLKDSIGTALSFNEDLYDLVTPADLIEQVPEEVVTPVTTSEEVAEPVLTETGNIVEVALTTKETPETGTTTSILVLLALVLNLAFFLRKRFIK